MTQLINSPGNTCVSLLIPAPLNHSVFHLSVPTERPRLRAVLFLHAAAAAVSSCPSGRYSNPFTSLVLFGSAMMPESFRRRRFLTFTGVFGISMNRIIHYFLYERSAMALCISPVWIPPFVLVSSSPPVLCQPGPRTLPIKDLAPDGVLRGRISPLCGTSKGVS